jgi:hypothetical protein
LEILTRERSVQLIYQMHDRIFIPEDIAALEVEKGYEGIVRELVLHNDTVTAFVEVSYSTGQTRGWILLEIMPEEKVLSYTLESWISPILPPTVSRSAVRWPPYTSAR